MCADYNYCSLLVSIFNPFTYTLRYATLRYATVATFPKHSLIFFFLLKILFRQRKSLSLGEVCSAFNSDLIARLQSSGSKNPTRGPGGSTGSGLLVYRSGRPPGATTGSNATRIGPGLTRYATINFSTFLRKKKKAERRQNSGISSRVTTCVKDAGKRETARLRKMGGNDQDHNTDDRVLIMVKQEF